MKDYYNDLKKLLRSLGFDELITKLDQIPNKENSPIEVIKMYNKYKRIAPPNDDINRMKDMNRMQERAGIRTENIDMEDVSDISKPNSEINQDLQDELDRLGIDPSVDGPITITFTNKSGKTKTVTMEKNGSFKVVNEINLSKTVVGVALMCSLVSGMMSCTVDKDVRPNNTQTELPSGDENVAPVDFLNTAGKDITLNNIMSGLGKYIPKPKFKKGDTVQYKQQTMKPDFKMQVPDSVNIPDSTTNRSDAPWVGYWKFTDPCRTNNQQVMIWTQTGDDMKKGIIYSGYQLPDTNTIFSARTYKILADGKKYIISAYTISSIYYDEAKAHMTVTMSSPESDSGKPRILEIDYSGDNMRITSWTAGNAIRVKDLSGFKW